MTVESLADRVRNSRMDLGLSQEQLAEIANIEVKTIQRLEQGLTLIPTLPTVYGLAKASGASMFHFFPTEMLEDLPTADKCLLVLLDFLHSEQKLKFLKNMMKNVSELLLNKK